MLEIATTVGTGAVVLIGVWRLIDARLNSLRQDLTGVVARPGANR